MGTTNGRDDLKRHLDPSPLLQVAGATCGDNVSRTVLSSMSDRDNVIDLKGIRGDSTVGAPAVVHQFDDIPLMFSDTSSLSLFHSLFAPTVSLFESILVRSGPYLSLLALQGNPFWVLSSANVRDAVCLAIGFRIVSGPLASGVSVPRYVTSLASRVETISTSLVSVIVREWLEFSAGYTRLHTGDCTTISIKGTQKCLPR